MLFDRTKVFIITASAILTAITGFASWSGLHDFMKDTQTSESLWLHESLLILLVTTLTLLMWFALHQMFVPRQSRRYINVAAGVIYAFLLCWSVSFGLGFWWSVISGSETTRTNLVAMRDQTVLAAARAEARADAIKAAVDSIDTWSTSQMAREEKGGGSCGLPSSSGRGNLYAARKLVHESVLSMKGRALEGFYGPVKDSAALTKAVRVDLPVVGREDAFRNAVANLSKPIAAINTLHTGLASSLASDMKSLAASISIAPGNARFACYDPSLAQRLETAAALASQPLDLSVTEAIYAEGVAGTAEAIRRMWRFIFGQESAAAFSGRDFIALLATIGLDLALFVLAIMERGHLSSRSEAPAMVSMVDYSRMTRNPDQVSLEQVLRAALDLMPANTLQWIRWHLVHHDGYDYFVFPNLYAVSMTDEREKKLAMTLNQVAGVLHNMKVVRPLTQRQLRKLGKAEQRVSDTGLAQHVNAFSTSASPDQVSVYNPVEAVTRNLGLFSKSHRALEIAGWSSDAQKQVEVYRLVDAKRGITDLITIIENALPIKEEKPWPSPEYITQDFDPPKIMLSASKPKNKVR